MCGIVGYLGKGPSGPFLLEGLRRLEYRGYDSAGVAVLRNGGEALLVRQPGRLDRLADRPEVRRGLDGPLGIAHTRWATHGPPTEANAHPHTDCHGRVFLVHNGIVRNWEPLRRELEGRGHAFRSETDTEVLCHLIEEELAGGAGPEEALRRALRRAEGDGAVALFVTGWPHLLVGGRKGRTCALLVGEREDARLLASDLVALAGFASRAFPVPPDHVVALSPNGVHLTDLHGRPAPFRFLPLPLDAVQADAGRYPHFYLKEVYEQPAVIARLAEGARAEVDRLRALLPLDRLPRVHLVGMGSSLYAAHLGRWFLQRVAGQPASADSAAEADSLLLGPEDLLVAITQSGETADTLHAIARARERGVRVLAVCNREMSEAVRQADAALLMGAGPEQCVVATKTFTASLVLLYLLALAVAEARGALSREGVEASLKALASLPERVEEVLNGEEYRELALQVAGFEHLFLIARGPLVPAALEGALKLKEAAYLHAEALPAGDLKHGPLALIQPTVLTLALAFRAWEGSRTLSNVQEVRARGGPVVVLGDVDGAEGVRTVRVPTAPSPELQPLLAVPPLQLLAYYTGLLRGADVDRPRNLAKVVTVE